MDLIIKHRAHGKTSDLVKMSAYTGIPIISANAWHVKERARELGYEIPEPIDYLDAMNGAAEGVAEVYVNDANIILGKLLGTKIAGCAMTIDDD